jgi:hypothetical protein
MSWKDEVYKFSLMVEDKNWEKGWVPKGYILENLEKILKNEHVNLPSYLIEEYEEWKGKHKTKFLDERLEGKIATPDGRIREYFIALVNSFTLKAHELELYPRYPKQLDLLTLSALVADQLDISPETAKKRIIQLDRLGFVKIVFKLVKNPLLEV